MARLNFGGERIGQRSIADVCNYDENEVYMIVHTGCEWEVMPIQEGLKTLDGYVASSAQTLTHDVSGNLLRA